MAVDFATGPIGAPSSSSSPVCTTDRRQHRQYASLCTYRVTTVRGRRTISSWRCSLIFPVGRRLPDPQWGQSEGAGRRTVLSTRRGLGLDHPGWPKGAPRFFLVPPLSWFSEGVTLFALNCLRWSAVFFAFSSVFSFVRRCICFSATFNRASSTSTIRRCSWYALSARWYSSKTHVVDSPSRCGQ